MKHIFIWPDRDTDPPATLWDGSAADWLRWGSQGGNDGHFGMVHMVCYQLRYIRRTVDVLLRALRS